MVDKDSTKSRIEGVKQLFIFQLLIWPIAEKKNSSLQRESSRFDAMQFVEVE